LFVYLFLGGGWGGGGVGRRQVQIGGAR